MGCQAELARGQYQIVIVASAVRLWAEIVLSNSLVTKISVISWEPRTEGGILESFCSALRD